MNRYVLLLRGINVGRANRLAMADLRTVLGSLDYTEVRTLLNSGNALFEAPPEPCSVHAARVRHAIRDMLGLDLQVVVKDRAKFRMIVAGNALRDLVTDHARLLVVFTGDDSELAGLSVLARRDWSPETLHVGDHAAYAWCANGILASDLLPAVGRALGDRATTRNWNTVEKLHSMLSGAQRSS